MAKQKLNFMNSVKVPNPKQSVFDLTHDVKLSANMGWLVPTMVMDCVPGDKVQIDTQALVRFAPLISPMMHRVNVTFHTWAIPYRILWPNWSDYITETKSGAPPVLPAFPTVNILNDGSNYGELLDYLGIPPIDTTLPVAFTETISAMRLAAYQCVYHHFYRDQNLQQLIEYELSDGDNTAVGDLFQLRQRAWGHDYFTSNLPFAQKGDAVNIPMTFNDVPVIFDPKATNNPGSFVDPVTGADYSGIGAVRQEPGPVPFTGSTFLNDGITDPEVAYDPRNTLIADNSSGSGSLATVNDLRLSMQLQKYLERAARAGTRLVEWIKGMFGETLPDYTAQIPQYIGGSISPVQISEVLNTTGDPAGLPQGNMSGRGISVNSGKQGFYHAREHCVVMTIMSVMPETVYQQGIEREWKKFNDPKDFLNPLFVHLGEQATINSELAAYTANRDETFGYLPRYSEYRTIPNRVAGDFRTSQNYWTMSRIFDLSTGDTPGLNEQFIEADPTHRVFADTDPATKKLYIQVLNRIRAVRPLSKYGTPGI